MYIILGQVEIYFVCNYAEQLLITTVLFHQQSINKTNIKKSKLKKNENYNNQKALQFWK